MADSAVSFLLLGPLEVRVDRAPVVVAGARRRALLARLLINANELVPAERLIEDLWGDDRPAHPANALQAYISHLRAVLEPGRAGRMAGGVLVTRRPGYVLTVDPDDLDTMNFVRLGAEGRAALAAGRATEASALLGDALALWRGPALAEFADQAWAAVEVARLEELRWTAVEDRMEADLALGRHAAVVGQAEAAVADQPLRERLWAHRMLALYRAGRQAEALRAFAALRRQLGEELGIEPSPELARLEEAILLQKPELDWQPAGAVRPVAGPAPAGPPPAGPVLLGREKELAGIDRALEGLWRGPGALVLAGEAGIGKTSLLAELARRAEERGQLVLRARAAEFERDLPFGIFVDALDAYLADARDHGGDQRAELGAIFPSLAGWNERGATLAEERYRSYGAVRRLLEQLAAPRPLVLMLDDAHWADAASVELIAYLLARPARAAVLLAVAIRPGQAPAGLLSALHSAERTGVVERMDLGPLSSADVEALVGNAVGPSARRRLARESGGNPFYLEQLLRTHRIVHDATPMGEAMAPGLTVPAAVLASIAEELGALAVTSRTAAWGAAVVGETFEPELVADAAGLSRPDTLRALDDLLRAQLVCPTEQPRRFRFRHPVVRRAVYESAGGGWRLGAHGRAAEALVARGASPAALAHHVEQSACLGDHEAVARLAAAGDDASSRAPAVAARWYRAALQLLPGPSSDNDRRLDLLIRLAAALGNAGLLEESHRTLTGALELVPTDAPALGAQLVAFCAAIEHLLGRHGDADRRLVDALAQLNDEPSAEAAALLIELAVGGIYASDWDRREHWALRAVEISRDLDDEPLAAAAASILALIQTAIGRLADGLSTADTAGGLFDGLHDPRLSLRLDAAVYLGWAECFLERYDAAGRHLDRGMALCRTTGQGQFLLPTMLGKAYTDVMRGRLDEANHLAGEATEAARLSRTAHLLLFALWTHCWAAAMKGDVEKALGMGHEALGLVEECGPGVHSASTGWAVGTALLEAGEAERCIEVIVRLTGGPTIPLIIPAHRCMAMEILTRAEVARGRFDEARAWSLSAEATAATLGLGVPAAQAARARSVVMAATGEADAAVSAAFSALESAERIGARLESARSRLLAGRLLASTGERAGAAAELSQAQSELAACKAKRFCDEATEELRRLGERTSLPLC